MKNIVAHYIVEPYFPEIIILHHKVSSLTVLLSLTPRLGGKGSYLPL